MVQRRFFSRKMQILGLVGVILSANVFAVTQMMTIDLQGHLVQMGYLPDEQDSGFYIIPPRKPDFKGRLPATAPA